MALKHGCTEHDLTHAWIHVHTRRWAVMGDVQCCQINYIIRPMYIPGELVKQKEHFLQSKKYKYCYKFSAAPRFTRHSWQNVWAVCDSALPCGWNGLWAKLWSLRRENWLWYFNLNTLCTVGLEWWINNVSIVSGYFGIDKTQCVETRGCCWNDEIPVRVQSWKLHQCSLQPSPVLFFLLLQGVPWCYRDTTKTCDPDKSRLDCGKDIV